MALAIRRAPSSIRPTPAAQLLSIRALRPCSSSRQPAVMTRASTGLNRFFAMLPYSIPLFEGARYSDRWFSSWTAFAELAEPLRPLQDMYWSSPFFSLVVWAAVWLGVVRNSSVDGYVRFNAAQALILAVFLKLPYWTERILNISLSGDIYSVIYALGFVALVYALIKAVLGQDTNLPLVGGWAAKI